MLHICEGTIPVVIHEIGAPWRCAGQHLRFYTWWSWLLFKEKLLPLLLDGFGGRSMCDGRVFYVQCSVCPCVHESRHVCTVQTER